MTLSNNPATSQFAADVLQDFPRPDHIALDALKAWLDSRQPGLDPSSIEVATLHYRSLQGEQRQGFDNDAVRVKATPLVNAVFENWQGEQAAGAVFHLGDWAGPQPLGTIHLVDDLPHIGNIFYNGAQYLIYSGLYQRQKPEHYGPDNHIGIRAEDLQQFIWDLDFHSTYVAALDNYWNKQADSHRTASKLSFINACNRQTLEGSLSDAGVSLAWQAAELEPRSEHFSVRALNVYGYSATDLLYIHNSQSDRCLLYIPGNAAPLHEFKSSTQMQIWFAEQCRDSTKRTALEEHFALADRPDGLEFTGLHSALRGLAAYPRSYDLPPNRPGVTASGWWKAQTYVNYKLGKYSPAIEDDLFATLTQRQKARSYADADFLITTRSDVIKADCSGYLTSAINLLGPLAIVVPELAPIFALGGVAQFGLGLDQVINGRSLEQKESGVSLTSFGLLNALPLAGQAWSEGKSLFQTQFDGFVAPSKINGQVGYPLSPPGPPMTNWAGQNFEAFFEQPRPVRPITASSGTVAISRQTTHAGMDTLINAHGPQTHWVYDLDADAFVKEHEINGASPTRFIAQDAELTAYQPQVNGPREVTDAMRKNTLQNLGIDLPLPVEVPRVTGVNQAHIPKKVLQIWVGDAPLTPSVITRLTRNSRLLNDAGYDHILYLSSRSNFDMTRRALAEAAPTLRVLPIEHQDFFALAESTPPFKAAMSGPAQGGAHLTAATDMLKYRALYQEGGLYMDIDNDLLAPASHPAAAGIINEASPAEWIGNVPLQTTPEGLLLEQPTSNPFRGAHQQYNTSVIGSHPNNPTLQKVVEEMNLRTSSRQNFFTQQKNWPRKGAHAPSYAQYAKDLSNLTGVNMFNEIVDRNLPAYRQMRQIYKLLSCPLLKFPTLLGADLQPLSNEDLQATLQSLFGISRVVRVNRGFAWRNLSR